MTATKQQVTSLYKRILRLHCNGLPVELRAVGDQYVRDEFKRHRNAKPAETDRFLAEWTNYCITLATQLTSKIPVGKDLTPEQLEQFRDEQISQLYELKVEAEKPKLAG